MTYVLTEFADGGTVVSLHPDRREAVRAMISSPARKKTLREVPAEDGIDYLAGRTGRGRIIMRT